MILPIAFIVLLVNIRNFAFKSNAHGVGTPRPVQSLAESISSTKKLVIVQPPGLGSDVAKVVSTITGPLNSSQNVVYTNDNSNLVTLCGEGFKGVSDCFAAVVFYDSPLTTGGSRIWNYTIRFDSAMNGMKFNYNQYNNDPQSVMLPFQVAIDNAITNSTIVPNEYLFTSVSQKTADDESKRTFQKLIVSTYGIAFFITMVSLVYHVVGMITSERESGMTQLIDAMGGSAGARICSYILAFDIMYLPSVSHFPERALFITRSTLSQKIYREHQLLEPIIKSWCCILRNSADFKPRSGLSLDLYFGLKFTVLQVQLYSSSGKFLPALPSVAPVYSQPCSSIAPSYQVSTASLAS